MTVNKEAMRAWIDALRSGEFKQGKMRLHALEGGEHTFCCLGVACEVAMRHGVELTVQTKPSGSRGEWYGYETGDYGTNYTSLPVAVRHWLGVKSDNVYLTHPDHEPTSAMGANDKLNWGFGRIADALEYTYLVSGPDGERLQAAVENLESGGGKEHKLIEEAEL